jgi:cell division transport system permease protein
MNIWFRQHRFALGAAFSQLRKAPGSFLFNVLVVAVALALPFAGVTLLDNVRPMSEQLSVDPEISLFMKTDAPREQAQALAPQLQQILAGSKAKVSFVPREQALDNLKAKSGLSDVIETLGENPLPDSYVMKLEGFTSRASDAARVDGIAEQMKALLTLGVVVIAVVFNTIRLQVLTQRDEIAVSKLLGATDNFIHRPFYYTGALLGLCAGAVALGAVSLALRPLNAAIAEFARLYASEFQLAPLAPLGLAGLLAISAGLGLVGAMLSVQRHLARLN